MAMARWWRVAAALAVAVAVLAPSSAALDRSKFRRCDQSSFCRRNRALAAAAAGVPEAQRACSDPAAPPAAAGGALEGSVRMPSGHVASLSLGPTHWPGVLRLRIAQASSKRYGGPVDVLMPAGRDVAGNASASSDGHARVEFEAPGGRRAVATLSLCPFSLDVEVLGDKGIKMTANARGLMALEHRRASRAEDTAFEATIPDPAASKPDIWDDESDGLWEAPRIPNPAAAGRWEEEFGSFKDSKPWGPQDAAIDVRFHGSNVALYGLPERAAPLQLRVTRGPGSSPSDDPYRLWNADVFEYDAESSSPQSIGLYGSIPLVVAHAPGSGTAALLWLNSAETWVDVSRADGATDTHWMSESGAVDAFFFVGPTPADVFAQVSAVAGRAPVPAAFALAYHQCKWNYRTQAEVAEVDEGFDKAEVPYDVLWLDIEHTDAKKYFTWDRAKFPSPAAMQRSLAAKGRRMVTIVDPHIKSDSAYSVFSGAERAGLFVRDAGGAVYKGKCWPGDSSWIDFLNPKAREYWAEQYAAYPEATQSLFTWNDMNEPSVFEGPETTMARDARHYGDVEHRDVHNVYGHYMTVATHDALVKRGKSQDLRPFVLSRSFFVGTQRYAAVWTGDNKADWSHLAIAQPMLLSLSISGMPYVGSDVGGFFGNTEPELLVRWYQAACWHPFFRAHAHIESRRREPFMFADPHLSAMREAVQTRYRFLPYWYTLARQHAQTGQPLMRPLWAEFPDDAAVLDESSAFMVGPSVLVAPVTARGATSVKVRFPGRRPWYNSLTGERVVAMTTATVPMPLDRAPVFLRGGSVVPTRQRPRRSSAAMARDPYTLVVSLDGRGEARGELYADDGQTFAYTRGAFVDVAYAFAEASLASSVAAGDAAALPEALRGVAVERVVVNGLKRCPGGAKLAVGGAEVAAELRVTCDRASGQATVHRVSAPAWASWRLTLN
eukprot:m51a1_g6574 putative neutral alpha-glucosidase ab-like (948) ;mRNA; r:191047-194366